MADGGGAYPPNGYPIQYPPNPSSYPPSNQFSYPSQYPPPQHFPNPSSYLSQYPPNPSSYPSQYPPNPSSHSPPQQIPRNSPDLVEELHQIARMFYEQDCDQHEFLNKFGFAHYSSKANQTQVYLQTLQQAIPHVKIDKIFALVDRNGNGVLEFWELITLLYVLDAKLYCDSCYEVTVGARMWCENCRSGMCYGVCVTCFRSANLSHPHRIFYDNHMLLKGLASKQNLGSAEAPFQAMDPVEQMRLEQMARMNLQAELQTLLSLPLPNI